MMYTDSLIYYRHYISDSIVKITDIPMKEGAHHHSSQNIPLKGCALLTIRTQVRPVIDRHTGQNDSLTGKVTFKKYSFNCKCLPLN
jgi:hypothetical protein